MDGTNEAHVKRLNGKTVAITGAAQKVGKALAELLAGDYGCTVFALDSAPPAEGWSIPGGAGKIHFVECDICDEPAWPKVTETMAAMTSHIDMLINAGSVSHPFAKFTALTIEECRKSIKPNLFGVLFGIHALFPLIAKSVSPGIVNISDSTSMLPLPGFASHSASQSALNAFTESLQGELSGNMVRVTLVITPQELLSEDGDRHAAEKRHAKYAKKIAVALNRGKKRIVIGSDPRVMGLIHRISPSLAARFIAWEFRTSKRAKFISLFADERKK